MRSMSFVFIAIVVIATAVSAQNTGVGFAANLSLVSTTSDRYVFRGMFGANKGANHADHTFTEAVIELETNYGSTSIFCEQCSTLNLSFDYISSNIFTIRDMSNFERQMDDLYTALESVALNAVLGAPYPPVTVSFRISKPQVVHPGDVHRMDVKDPFYTVHDPATFADAQGVCSSSVVFGRRGRLLNDPLAVSFAQRFWVDVQVSFPMMNGAGTNSAIYDLDADFPMISIRKVDGTSAMLDSAVKPFTNANVDGIIVDRVTGLFEEAGISKETVICIYESAPGGDLTLNARYPLRGRVRYNAVAGAEGTRTITMPINRELLAASGSYMGPTSDCTLLGKPGNAYPFVDESGYTSFMCVAVDGTDILYKASTSETNPQRIPYATDELLTVAAVHSRNGLAHIIIHGVGPTQDVFHYLRVKPWYPPVTEDIDVHTLEGTPRSSTINPAFITIAHWGTKLYVAYTSSALGGLRFISRELADGSSWTFLGALGWTSTATSIVPVFDVSSTTVMYALVENRSSTPGNSLVAIVQGTFDGTTFTWNPTPRGTVRLTAFNTNYTIGVYRNGVVDVCESTRRFGSYAHTAATQYFNHYWFSRTASVSNPTDAGDATSSCFAGARNVFGRSQAQTEGTIVNHVFSQTTAYGSFDTAATSGRFCAPLPWEAHTRTVTEKYQCFSTNGVVLQYAGGEFPSGNVIGFNGTLPMTSVDIYGAVSRDRKVIAIGDTAVGSKLHLRFFRSPGVYHFETLNLSPAAGVRVAPFFESHNVIHVFTLKTNVSLSTLILGHQFATTLGLYSGFDIASPIASANTITRAYSVQTGDCTGTIFILCNDGSLFALNIRFCGGDSNGFKGINTASPAQYVPQVRVASIALNAFPQKALAASPTFFAAHVGNGDIHVCYLDQGMAYVSAYLRSEAASSTPIGSIGSVTRCAGMWLSSNGAPELAAKLTREEWNFYTNPQLCSQQCERTRGCRSWLLWQPIASMSVLTGPAEATKLRCALYNSAYAASYRSPNAFAYGYNTDLASISSYGTFSTGPTASSTFAGSWVTADHCAVFAAGALFSFTTSFKPLSAASFANATPGLDHVCPSATTSNGECLVGLPCCRIFHPSQCSSDYADKDGVLGNVAPNNATYFRFPSPSTPGNDQVCAPYNAPTPDMLQHSTAVACQWGTLSSTTYADAWAHNVVSLVDLGQIFTTGFGWFTEPIPASGLLANPPTITVRLTSNYDFTAIQFVAGNGGFTRLSVYGSQYGYSWVRVGYLESVEVGLNIINIFNTDNESPRLIRLVFEEVAAPDSQLIISSLAVTDHSEPYKRGASLRISPPPPSCILHDPSPVNWADARFVPLPGAFTSTSECEAACCGNPFCSRTTAGRDVCTNDQLVNQGSNYVPPPANPTDPKFGGGVATCTAVYRGALPSGYMFGSEYCNVPATDPFGCAAACCLQSECNTWVYDAQSRRCSLNSANYFSAPSITNWESTYGVKPAPSSPTETHANLLTHLTFEGAVDFQLLVKKPVAGVMATLSACEDACASTATCNAFTLTQASDGGGPGEAFGVSYCSLFYSTIAPLDVSSIADNSLYTPHSTASSGLLGFSNDQNLDAPLVDPSTYPDALFCANPAPPSPPPGPSGSPMPSPPPGPGGNNGGSQTFVVNYTSEAALFTSVILNRANESIPGAVSAIQITIFDAFGDEVLTCVACGSVAKLTKLSASEWSLASLTSTPPTLGVMLNILRNVTIRVTRQGARSVEFQAVFPGVSFTANDRFQPSLYNPVVVAIPSPVPLSSLQQLCAGQAFGRQVSALSYFDGNSVPRLPKTTVWLNAVVDSNGIFSVGAGNMQIYNANTGSCSIVLYTNNGQQQPCTLTGAFDEGIAGVIYNPVTNELSQVEPTETHTAVCVMTQASGFNAPLPLPLVGRVYYSPNSRAADFTINPETMRDEDIPLRLSGTYGAAIPQCTNPATTAAANAVRYGAGWACFVAVNGTLQARFQLAGVWLPWSTLLPQVTGRPASVWGSSSTTRAELVFIDSTNPLIMRRVVISGASPVATLSDPIQPFGSAPMNIQFAASIFYLPGMQTTTILLSGNGSVATVDCAGGSACTFNNARQITFNAAGAQLETVHATTLADDEDKVLVWAFANGRKSLYFGSLTLSLSDEAKTVTLSAPITTSGAFPETSIGIYPGGIIDVCASSPVSFNGVANFLTYHYILNAAALHTSVQITDLGGALGRCMDKPVAPSGSRKGVFNGPVTTSIQSSTTLFDRSSSNDRLCLANPISHVQMQTCYQPMMNGNQSCVSVGSSQVCSNDPQDILEGGTIPGGELHVLVFRRAGVIARVLVTEAGSGHIGQSIAPALRDQTRVVSNPIVQNTFVVRFVSAPAVVAPSFFTLSTETLVHLPSNVSLAASYPQPAPTSALESISFVQTHPCRGSVFAKFGTTVLVAFLVYCDDVTGFVFAPQQNALSFAVFDTSVTSQVQGAHVGRGEIFVCYQHSTGAKIRYFPTRAAEPSPTTSSRCSDVLARSQSPIAYFNRLAVVAAAPLPHQCAAYCESLIGCRGWLLTTGSDRCMLYSTAAVTRSFYTHQWYFAGSISQPGGNRGRVGVVAPAADAFVGRASVHQCITATSAFRTSFTDALPPLTTWAAPFNATGNVCPSPPSGYGAMCASLSEESCVSFWPSLNGFVSDEPMNHFALPGGAAAELGVPASEAPIGAVDDVAESEEVDHEAGTFRVFSTVATSANSTATLGQVLCSLRPCPRWESDVFDGKPLELVIDLPTPAEVVEIRFEISTVPGSAPPSMIGVLSLDQATNEYVAGSNGQVTFSPIVSIFTLRATQTSSIKIVVIPAFAMIDGAIGLGQSAAALSGLEIIISLNTGVTPAPRRLPKDFIADGRSTCMLQYSAPDKFIELCETTAFVNAIGRGGQQSPVGTPSGVCGDLCCGNPACAGATLDTFGQCSQYAPLPQRTPLPDLVKAVAPVIVLDETAVAFPTCATVLNSVMIDSTTMTVRCTLRDQSPRQCATRCCEDPYCGAFEFDVDTKRCTLYETGADLQDPTAVSFAPSETSIVGLKNTQPATTDLELFHVVEFAHATFDASLLIKSKLLSGTSATYDNCASLCNSESTCNGFTFEYAPTTAIDETAPEFVPRCALFALGVTTLDAAAPLATDSENAFSGVVRLTGALTNAGQQLSSIPFTCVSSPEDTPAPPPPPLTLPPTTIPPGTQGTKVKVMLLTDSIASFDVDGFLQAIADATYGDVDVSDILLANFTFRAPVLIIDLFVSGTADRALTIIDAIAAEPEELSDFPIRGAKLASDPSEQPLILSLSSNITTCQDFAFFEAEKYPLAAISVWSANNGSIPDPYEDFSYIEELPIGLTRITYSALNYDLRASQSFFVNRLPPIVASAGENQAPTGNRVTMAASAPAGANVRWEVLEGTAIISNIRSPTATVEGTGYVLLMWTVTTPACGNAFYFVEIDFPLKEACDPAVDCSNNGVCDDFDNSCVCFANEALGFYDGLSCDRCASGYVGARCTEQEPCREGTPSCQHGTCSNGQCVCHADVTRGFWSGTFCDACLESDELGYWAGDECNFCLSGFFPAANAIGATEASCTVFCDSATQCSGHGICSSVGKCVCFANAASGFWTGEYCDACLTPYSGEQCKTSCNASTSCSGHGICVEGECSCFASVERGYWVSTDPFDLSIPGCDVCAEGFTGATCTQRDTVCSEFNCFNGACNSAGLCVCTRSNITGMWTGPTCDQCVRNPTDGFWAGESCNECQLGYWGPRCDRLCPRNCSGHGTCSTASNGGCVCDSDFERGFWTGDALCATCASGYRGAQCLARCVQGETCFNGVCNAAGVCECFASPTTGYFGGATCSQCLTTPTRSYTGDQCLNCTANFFGTLCDRFCSSFETCSGNGECSADGTCVCFNNSARGFFTGARCDTCVAGKQFPECRTDIVVKDFSSCSRTFVTTFVSATLDSTFTTLEIVLSAAGDQGEVFRASNPTITNGDCRNYFVPAAVTKLGTGARCRWRTASLLVATLGPDNTVSFNDTLVIFPFAVVAIDTTATGAAATRCGDGNALASLSVRLPSGVRAPTAVLITRSEVGRCEGVTLDATGTRRTSPKSRFTYTTLDRNAPAALRNLLVQLSGTSPIAELPPGFVSVGTSRFRLEVVDGFTGLSSSVVVNVTKLGTTPPVIDYRGTSTVTYVGAEGTRLVINAAFTPCATAGASRSLQAVWSFNPPVDTTQMDLRSFSLDIPANALRTGVVYTATVNVTELNNGTITATSLSSTRSITLVPTPSPLTSRFSGSLGRVSRLNSLLVTMVCTDPDNTTATVLDATATWTCTGSACDATLSALLRQSSSAVLSLAPQWTSATQGDVVLVAQCTLNGKTASGNATLNVTDIPMPLVTVTAPRTATPNEKVAIAVELQNVASPLIKWTCLAPCTYDLADPAVSPLGDTSRNLVINPGALAGGSTYTFRITVSDAANPATAAATADATVRVFRGPSGGTFVSNRIALTTFDRVELRAANWVTEPENYPLNYAIFHVSERGVRTPLSALSPNPTAGVRVTNVASAEVYSFELFVQDRSGSSATVQLHLLATFDSVGANSLGALGSDAERALRQGRESDVLGTFVSMSTGFNENTDETTIDLLTKSVQVKASNANQMASIASSVGNGIAGGATTKSLDNVLNVAKGVKNFADGNNKAVGQSAFGVVGAVTKAMNSPKTPAARRRRAEDNLRQAVEAAELAGDLSRSMQGGALDGENLKVENNELQLSCSRLGTGESDGASNSAGSSSIKAPNLSGVTNASSIDLCVLQYNSNPFSGADNGTTLGANLVAFDVNDNAGGKVNVSGPPMVFTLKRDPATSNDEPRCVWFDRNAYIYREDGCNVTFANATIIECTCSHLTEFSVKINKVDFGNFADIKVAGTALISIIGGLFGVLVVFGFILDQLRQRRYILEKRVFAAKAKVANVSGAVTAEALCSRQRMQVQPEQLRGWSLYFWSLGQNHPWLSPFFGHPASNVTAPQRVTVLFLSIMVSLFANGLTFQGGDDGKLDGGQAVLQTFFAILISVPMGFCATYLVQFFFQHTPRTPFDMSHRYKPTAEEVAAAKAKDDEAERANNEPTEDALGGSDYLRFTKTTAETAHHGLKPALPNFLDTALNNPATANRAKVLASIDAVLKSMASQPRVVIDHEAVIQTALSCDMRQRHLAGLSLQALILAESLKTKPDALLGTSGVRAVDFVRQIGQLLAIPVTERVPSDDEALVSLEGPHFTEEGGNIFATGYTNKTHHDATSAGSAVSHSALVISCVMQNYVGSEALAPACFFPRNSKKQAIVSQLYGTEMNGAVWRMAIECVRMQEMVLAEALFTFHLLLENPDLYFVLFDAPRADKVDDVVAVVLAAACSYEPFGADNGPNVGRMWASFYANFLLGLDETGYATAHALSDTPSIDTIIALLDLTPGRPIVEFGCVSYSLQVEKDLRTPSLASAIDFVVNPKFESFVQAAHVFRLAPKPNLDQRWTLTEKERVEIATTNGRVPLPHVQESVEATNREIAGNQYRESTFYVAHGTPTFLEVVRLIRRVENVQKYRTNKSLYTSTRYYPGSTETVFDVPPLLMPLLNDRLKNVLLSANSAHSNFYATIECGRLFALAAALETKSCTMAEFGTRYVRELNDLALRRKDKFLRLVDEGQWVSATSDEAREHEKEVSGNNILSNTFDDASDPVLIAAITANGSGRYEQRRLAVAAIQETGKPLTILAKFHPPNCMGTGSEECPHVGITSAVSAAFLGDRVELAAGNYPTAQIANCQGTLANELVVAPRGYFEKLNEAAAGRKLSAEERAQIDEVHIGLKKLSEKPLVTFSESSHIRIAGVHFARATITATSSNSPECTIVHSIISCEAPYSTDSTPVITAESNDVTATGTPLRQMLISRTMPWQMVVFGYILGFGLFLMFAFLSLFLTSAYSERKANEWAIRSAVSILIIALVVNPIVIGGMSQFVLLSNIILSLEAAL